jgi:hypothetical protein
MPPCDRPVTTPSPCDRPVTVLYSYGGPGVAHQLSPDGGQVPRRQEVETALGFNCRFVEYASHCLLKQCLWVVAYIEILTYLPITSTKSWKLMSHHIQGCYHFNFVSGQLKGTVSQDFSMVFSIKNRAFRLFRGLLCFFISNVRWFVEDSCYSPVPMITAKKVCQFIYAGVCYCQQSTVFSCMFFTGFSF